MKHAAKALVRDEQGRILVLYRSETHPHLAHDIDLPGGEIEHGELAEVGLSREIIEETGLNIVATSEDLVHSWRSVFGSTHMLYEVALSDNSPVQISWEHESYTWMSTEEFTNHAAVDEFMHRVQEWLGLQESSSYEQVFAQDMI